MGIPRHHEQTRSSLIYDPDALPAGVGERLRSPCLER